MKTDNTSRNKHLKAWRKFRKLSQEQVAEMLNITQTTIGRWERGVVTITDKDFENLAKAYSASIQQLMAPPEEAKMVERLEETYKIMLNMDEDALHHWLEIGKNLAKK